MPKLHVQEGLVDKEIDIPPGFERIKSGLIQDGDYFLIGGIHNLLITPPRFQLVKQEDIGKDIFEDVLIIRPQKAK